MELISDCDQPHPNIPVTWIYDFKILVDSVVLLTTNCCKAEVKVDKLLTFRVSFPCSSAVRQLRSLCCFITIQTKIMFKC